jgi:hypothetical protein
MVRLKVPGSNRGSGSVVTGGGGCSSYVASQDLLIGIVLIPTPLLARGGGGGLGCVASANVMVVEALNGIKTPLP